jgi:hypothetical protein
MRGRFAPDLTGQSFGKWLVVARAANRSWGGAVFQCICVCGVKREVAASDLRRGSTSCGCDTLALQIKHGHARYRTQGHRTPTYNTWLGMIQRCEYPHHKDYKHYGARGITVCDRWRTSFANFLADMGKKPAGLTLDRIDPDGNYEFGNCRWATPKEQRHNRRQHGRAADFGASV